MMDTNIGWIQQREWSPIIQLVFVSGRVEAHKNEPAVIHNPQLEPTPLLSGPFLVGGAY